MPKRSKPVEMVEVPVKWLESLLDLGYLARTNKHNCRCKNCLNYKRAEKFMEKREAILAAERKKK